MISGQEEVLRVPAGEVAEGGEREDDQVGRERQGRGRVGSRK